MKYLLLLISILPIRSMACSAFFCEGPTMFFAKNFDWSSGEGYIIQNPSGQKKYAYGLRGTNQSSWTSKYGSVTFNQIGKEFPYGGMNEKGLVVEQLWMSESIYEDNKNNTISELEWIQYQLDNYSTVAEVIKHIHDLTVKPIATVHYFIADRDGYSAVIDFVEGKTVIHEKKGKQQVITNETFARSEAYFAESGALVDTSSRTNLDRYCQLKNNLKNLDLSSAQQAFDILDKSSENRENYKTYWSIVYDLTNLKVYYKTLENPEPKSFDLAKLDFRYSQTIKASDLKKNSFHLEEYTAEVNKIQFTKSMKMMGIRLDEDLATRHQMNPGLPRIDSVYQQNYMDLTIHFRSRQSKGNIYYTIIQGEENFKKRKGIRSGLFSINKKENLQVIYALPKGEYAIACFQDADLNNKIDTKIFGIPKNYGFSRNKRGFFGQPPSYEKALVGLYEDTELTIKIK